MSSAGYHMHKQPHHKYCSVWGCLVVLFVLYLVVCLRQSFTMQLELTVQARLTSDTQRSRYLCFQGVGIKGVCPHTWQKTVVLMCNSSVADYSYFTSSFILTLYVCLCDHMPCQCRWPQRLEDAIGFLKLELPVIVSRLVSCRLPSEHAAL